MEKAGQVIGEQSPYITAVIVNNGVQGPVCKTAPSSLAPANRATWVSRVSCHRLWLTLPPTQGEPGIHAVTMV